MRARLDGESGVDAHAQRRFGHGVGLRNMSGVVEAYEFHHSVVFFGGELRGLHVETVGGVGGAQKGEVAVDVEKVHRPFHCGAEVEEYLAVDVGFRARVALDQLHVGGVHVHVEEYAAEIFGIDRSVDAQRVVVGAVDVEVFEVYHVVDHGHAVVDEAQVGVHHLDVGGDGVKGHISVEHGFGKRALHPHLAVEITA